MGTILKTCFRCKASKPRGDFYAHPKMADGLLGKCKECAKADVRERYRTARSKRVAYEQTRSRLPHRRARRVDYVRALRARDPVRAKAWNAVSNAIRDGRLTRKPCEVCGERRVQAHHADYQRPLDVRWLCFRHHRELEHGQTTTEDPGEKTK